MVAWLLKDGEDRMVSISVTEAMALSAALRTSCEHPGFTMLFTFNCGQASTQRSNEKKMVNQRSVSVLEWRKSINKVSKVPSPSTPATA